MLRSFDYAAGATLRQFGSGRAPELPRQRVVGAQPRSLRRGLRERDRRQAGDERRAVLPRVRDRQGRVRSRLRGSQPADLALHPVAGHRTSRRRGVT